MNFARLRQSWIVATALAAACSSASVGPVTDAALLSSLGIIRVGQVTRSEVEAALGAPLATYEGGRIAGYVLSEEDGQLGPYSGSGSPSFDLMLVYGDDGVLVRQSLVRKD